MRGINNDLIDQFSLTEICKVTFYKRDQITTDSLCRFQLNQDYPYRPLQKYEQLRRAYRPEIEHWKFWTCFSI